MSAGPPSGGETILDVALALADGENDTDFDVIVAAVVEAGLTDALDGNRQLTVFVPTDEAFNAARITEDGVGDVDDEFLLNVLTYHVTPGRRKAKSVTGSKKLPTLNGATIGVDETELNDGQASIVGPDAARASNGIVHVIDGVLLPSE